MRVAEPHPQPRVVHSASKYVVGGHEVADVCGDAVGTELVRDEVAQIEERTQDGTCSNVCSSIVRVGWSLGFAGSGDDAL
ncbi:hypothetical protein GCM10010399_76360 [Dactylosporangium fulvum]|uniref:Uncharacterized protein n=1 Tax=Dactylosporangium fulvum TaxID=53359 RepID=A0ABY5VQ99_9ACTN|nr:hypothetical protein [Dactylosporangium fulvum]UWP79249.1 hypothetical protein Dfulv_29250 [Dactylosporangium fulvum]